MVSFIVLNPAAVDLPVWASREPDGGFCSCIMGKIPRLSVNQILAWADTWYKRTGHWPKRTSGRIPETQEHWKKIDGAFKAGSRGLSGGSSLAKLLEKDRGVRRWTRTEQMKAQILSEEQIVAWAQDHHRRTGSWPNSRSGIVLATKRNHWSSIDQVLRDGTNGLPAGSTLAKLLVKRLKIRSVRYQPRLTVQQIMTWVDAHFKRTGTWPTVQSGPIPESPGETWGSVHSALVDRKRGLKRASSLPRLLSEKRGFRFKSSPYSPRLTQQQILAWADAHHRRIGHWPHAQSGSVFEDSNESWQAIDAALREGRRGLWGGSSVARLLMKHRNVKRPWRRSV